MPILYQDNKNLPAEDISMRVPEDAQFDLAPPSPGVLDTLKAGALVGSELVAGATYDPMDSTIQNPEYDLFPRIKGTVYEQFYEDAIGVDNDYDLEVWKSNIDKKLNAYQTLSQAGWGGQIAAMAGSLISPISFVPFVGQVKAFKTLNTIQKVGAGSAIGAAAAGTQEAIQGNFEPGKSASDYALATAAGAIFGGVLGGSIGLLAPGQGSISKSTIQAILKDQAHLKLDPDGGSVGAAWKTENMDAGLADFGNKDATVANVVLPTQFLKGPAMKSAVSPSPTMQNIGADLFETNWFLKGNKEFVPSPTSMSTLRELDQVEILDYHKSIDGLYKQYLQHVDSNVMDVQIARLTNRERRPMTEKELQTEVAFAMRRNDKHKIKEVEEMAEMNRQAIKRANAKMKEAGVELFQGEELKAKGAESYFTRIFDRAAISRDVAGFTKALKTWLVRDKKMDAMEAESEAMAMKDTLLGLQDSYPALYLRTKIDPEKGVAFIKSKTWEVPDAIVEKYLLNDARQVTARYVEQANRLSRWKTYLQDKGVSSERELADRIRADYDLMKTHLQGKLDTGKISEADFNKAILDADKSLADDLKNLEDSLAIMLGQYTTRTPADKFFQRLRSYQYITMLGGVVISSLSDLSMPIIKHGFGRTFMNGWLGGLETMGGDIGKLAIADQRRAMVGVELEMDSAIRQMIDPDVIKGAGNTYDQVIEKTTGIFSRVNLMSYWNNMGKRIAYRTAQARTLDDIINYDSVGKAEKEYLAYLGFGPEDIAKIQQEVKDGHIVKYKHTYITNTDQWADQALAERFNAGMLKEVNGTVVRAKEGDLPAWMQRSEVNKTLMQFRGFFFGFSNRVMVSALQRRDKNVAQGVAALVSMGAMSYIIKTKLSGKEPDYSPDNLIKQGISRSGLLGILTDPMFFAYKSLFGGQTGSRYFNDNMIEYVMGPSASRAQDLWELAGDLGHGNLSEKQADKALKFMPFNNVFWLRDIFDRLNGGK